MENKLYKFNKRKVKTERGKKEYILSYINIPEHIVLAFNKNETFVVELIDNCIVCTPAEKRVVIEVVKKEVLVNKIIKK